MRPRMRQGSLWAALADTRDCLVCERSTSLELVDCPDGHGDACPDRVCTGCGVVVVVAPAPPEALTA